jgi:hypothetical protein
MLEIRQGKANDANNQQFYVSVISYGTNWIQIEEYGGWFFLLKGGIAYDIRYLTRMIFS